VDSPSENTTYAVLSISRVYLQSLGLPPGQIEQVTDADRERIAAMLQAHYFTHDFDEDATFTTRLVLAEKEKPA